MWVLSLISKGLSIIMLDSNALIEKGEMKCILSNLLNDQLLSSRCYEIIFEELNNRSCDFFTYLKIIMHIECSRLTLLFKKLCWFIIGDTKIISLLWILFTITIAWYLYWYWIKFNDFVRLVDKLQLVKI